MGLRLPSVVPRGLRPSARLSTKNEPKTDGLVVYAPGWPVRPLARWLARHAEAPGPVGFALDRIPLPRSARLATILRDVRGWREQARSEPPPWQVPAATLRVGALSSAQHLDAGLWLCWALGAKTAFVALPQPEAAGPLHRWTRWRDAGGPLLLVTNRPPESSPYPMAVLSPAGHWWTRQPPKTGVVPLLVMSLDLPGPPASFLEPGTPIWSSDATSSGYRVVVSTPDAEAVQEKWGADVDMEPVMIDPDEIR